MEQVVYAALAVVPLTYVLRLLLYPLLRNVEAQYMVNTILALAVTSAVWLSAEPLDPLRMLAVWGLSHVVQRTTRFLEAAGDARRAETVRATRR